MATANVWTCSANSGNSTNFCNVNTNGNANNNIPPKRNRKFQRKYDEHLYKLRHLAENAFLHLKRRRGTAARYAKNTASFVAAIQIRRILIWANVLA